ncbi:MAG: putative dehydrogenase [Pedosphaera sp.]|nr:putative dehydrogenase [Pedosphaera sp.]
MKKKSLSRREFLSTSTLVAAGFWFGIGNASGKQENLITKQLSPNNRLNIGIIGTANRAQSNIAGVSSQNIVAVCDIDDNYLAAASQRFPDAKTYNDFRKLLEQKDVEAVVISTADHTHAVATLAALKAGKHVYCEKPLSHTVHEARVVSQTAAKHPKLATQMGTQIHAGQNYRRVVELVQSGAIGKVKECHVWCEKTWSGGDRPVEKPPVPKNIHWDLWLGPAAMRPYHPEYLPKNWRRWWEFGGGTLGDMGCHFMDLAFWALKLRHPLTIAAEGPPVNKETTPAWLIVNYEYDARGEMPPVRVTWHDGGKRPELVNEGKVPNWRNGVLFVGDKGMLLADYDRRKLLPESQYVDFVAPADIIPNSLGHYTEWVRACKYGSPTTCNFDYAGALSEAVLLGNVAFRTGNKIEWDAEALRAKNCKEASQYIHREYRKGWALPT